MLDLKKIPEIIQAKVQGTDVDMPKHIVVNAATAVNEPDESKKAEIEKRKLGNILEIVKSQLEFNIPVITISLGKKEDFFKDRVFYDFLNSDLKQMTESNRIRTTFIGKWYSLSGMVVEAIKKVVMATMEYDSYFLNICINYDGQEEIVDACRLMMRKMYDNKMDPDSVNIEAIKENIYTSYFMPPDLIIEMGNKLYGTFLWDSKNSRICFLNKEFQNYAKADFIKAIDYYKKNAR